ncbi:MAG: Holliday junction resolvase RuvX [Gracilibacteraceae bacterium]|jgi:putative Holliday junction resolvase|nr:Holliday junction resolvase RuvX [Gracilibacteraceae bacterium]
MPEARPRVLGLDLGDKKIGVAVSDVFGWTAQPVGVVRRGPGEMRDLAALVARYEAAAFLLGYPRNMNGTAGPRAQATEEYAALLRQKFSLPVCFWDERLTSVAAERALLEADLSRARRKLVVDQTAAALILQGYLDYQNGPGAKKTESARNNLTLPAKQVMIINGNSICGGGTGMADKITPEEELVDSVVLTDDEGAEHEFIHLETLEVDGNTYFVLLPTGAEDDEDEDEDEDEDVDEEYDEDDDEIEAIILKLEKNEKGEEILVDIEDDEEWEKVSDAWEELDDCDCDDCAED